MKKWIAAITALMMAVMCTAALAGGAEAEEEAIGLYDSVWLGSGGSISAVCMYGYWEVDVVNSDESIEWHYVCSYDEARRVLVSGSDRENTKTLVILDEDGSETDRITEYTDGRAEFALTERGTLAWTDMKEDAGAGMEYEKVGWYAPYRYRYASDNYFMDVFWADADEDADNAGLIVVVEDFGKNTCWTYHQVKYNAKNNTLEAALGLKEAQEAQDSALFPVYTDGTAVFSMDADRNVYWDEQKENAGEGEMFVLGNG